MSTLPEPLTPADCDLRDYHFMQIEVKRLLTSETWVLGTGDERAAAIALWLESWHQVPAASLPDNDRMLAHLSQCKTWKRVKEHALRGWVKCTDGKLYHPVVAEKALEAWISKLVSSLAGSAGNAKRWGIEVDTDSIKAQIIDAARLLQAIAPQSEWLRRKQVRDIVVGSPPDRKSIAPRQEKASPPESPPDRNREGEREGEGEEGIVTVVSTPPVSKATIPNPPTSEAHWASHFRQRHGFEVNPSSVHDRRKAWPIFAGWVNAGLTLERIDAAVAQAIAQATEPIAYLPGYVDRVIASQATQKPSATAARDQERADVIATLTGRKPTHERTADAIDVAARRVD